MMLLSNSLNSPAKGITFRNSLLSMRKHPMTPHPGNLVIPQRTFKATYQPEQMFNYNLGKITGGWKSRTFQTALPGGECGRLTVGWLSFAPQSRVVVNSRDGGASLCPGLPVAPIPGFSCIPSPSPDQAEPHSWDDWFWGCRLLGLLGRGFIHRQFTLPRSVSRRGTGRDKADPRPPGDHQRCLPARSPLQYSILNSHYNFDFGEEQKGKVKPSRGWDPECLHQLWNGEGNSGPNSIYFYSQL